MAERGRGGRQAWGSSPRGASPAAARGSGQSASPPRAGEAKLLGGPLSGPKGGRGGRGEDPVRAKVNALRAGDLIGLVVKGHGLDTQGRLDKLAEVWRRQVGAATAGKSRIVDLKGGVLTVEVANSALGQELSVYLKRDLITQLKAESGLKITDLRCRVGGWARD